MATVTIKSNDKSYQFTANFHVGTLNHFCSGREIYDLSGSFSVYKKSWETYETINIEKVPDWFLVMARKALIECITKSVSSTSIVSFVRTDFDERTTTSEGGYRPSAKIYTKLLEPCMSISVISNEGREGEMSVIGLDRHRLLYFASKIVVEDPTDKPKSSKKEQEGGIPESEVLKYLEGLAL